MPCFRVVKSGDQIDFLSRLHAVGGDEEFAPVIDRLLRRLDEEKGGRAVLLDDGFAPMAQMHERLIALGDALLPSQPEIEEASGRGRRFWQPCR